MGLEAYMLDHGGRRWGVRGDDGRASHVCESRAVAMNLARLQ